MAEEIQVETTLKKKYDHYYSDGIDLWRRIGAEQKASNIIRLCKEKKWNRILEVGAGDGNVIQILSDNKFANEYYAVDISESGIQKLKSRNIDGLIEAKVYDGYHIPYEDKHFDLVILTHVLEHVEFPRSILREIARVAEFQLIEVPRDYKTNVDQRIDKLLSYGHIMVYTPTLLRFLLKSEAFEILNHHMSFSSKEILAYPLKNAKKYGIIAQLKLNLFIFIRDMMYKMFPLSRKETMINAYTVLTSHK